jgi:pimeloyl-ACP methyl ester carboxylesterase
MIYGLLIARKWSSLITVLGGIYLTAGILIMIASWGIGWITSDELRKAGLQLEDQTLVYDLEVIAVSNDTITLRSTSETNDDSGWITDGLWGLESDSGTYHHVEDIHTLTTNQVERKFSPGDGELHAGDLVRVDSWNYPKNPFAGLGINYTEETYVSPLGAMPMWFVNGSKDTWAIFVHGKGADRGQSLRVLETISELSIPTLIIRYRNDPDTPLSSNGFYQYGATEWQDLEGSVNYALSNGAQHVVLVGYSMGGGIIASFLHNSSLAPHISGIVYDAPMLDFGQTVDYGAEQRGYPQFTVVFGKAVSHHRFGIEWQKLNYLQYIEELEAPILLFHGVFDERVPIETSDLLADTRSDLVTYVRIEEENAPHNAAWNVNPSNYKRALREFFEKVAR